VKVPNNNCVYACVRRKASSIYMYLYLFTYRNGP